MIYTNQKAIRFAFFVGLGLSILVRAFVWLFKRRLKARIAIIQAKTFSALLLGELAIHWHLDTAWVKIQWWYQNLFLHFQWWSEVGDLQGQVAWKSFLSYWDGFTTGAGFGLLLGVLILITLRTSKK